MSTLKVSSIVWRDASAELPAQDGAYFICTKYKRVCPLDYTVEGGWNTFRDTDGVLHTENAWDNKDRYVALWANVPTVEEVIVNEKE